jgi:[ribosomal protein S5]-alanine N-acetyltransferase
MRIYEIQDSIYSTKRIYVRSLKMQDVTGNYKKWLNDQDVCKYNSHGIFPTSKKNLEEYVKSLKVDNSKIVWAIIDKSNDNHLGNISLQSIDYINRTAEFAIIIGEKEYWGKGYASEAAELIARHGFKKLNLNRIYCGTASTNLGMQKLALKMKMKLEGRRRQDLFLEGKYVDTLEYGVLRSEYEIKL